MALDTLDTLQWAFIILLLILPVVYELSSTFKFYAKIFLYYGLTNIIALLLLPVFALRPGNVENYRIITAIFIPLRKLFGIGVEIRGQENLKSDKPFILILNHQSSLDFFGMMAIWPDRCTTLAKKEVKYLGPFGLASILVGTVFIDRQDHKKAKNTMDATAKEVIDKNVKLLIFPEGTRNHGGGLLPFKKGAFHIAIGGQIPIAPVVFSSYSDFYNKKERRFGTGNFVITCLPKISTEGLSSDDVTALSESTRKLMLDTFNQTSLEATQAKLANGIK